MWFPIYHFPLRKNDPVHAFHNKSRRAPIDLLHNYYYYGPWDELPVYIYNIVHDTTVRWARADVYARNGMR